MNTCGTCKHFGKLIEASLDVDEYDSDYEEVNTRFHECTLLKHLNQNRFKKGEPQMHVAGVIDGSGYRATFCVSEEFGCNQWHAQSR